MEEIGQLKTRKASKDLPTKRDKIQRKRKGKPVLGLPTERKR